MSEGLKTWECDACAESEGGHGLPCTLTSALIPKVEACPVSGDECEWVEVESRQPDKELVDAIEGALVISVLWTYPESECPENPTESQALSIMKTKFEQAIAKYKEKK